MMTEQLDAAAELLIRAKNGDREAFSSLAALYQKRVYASALVACSDPDLSEDVTQETFLIAYKSLNSLRSVDRLAAWLCGIAWKVAKRLARKRKLPSRFSDHISQDVPEQNLIASERTALVFKGLGRLSEKYRLVLSLRYVEGLSYSEIADRMGESVSSVESLLFRARQSFRDNMPDLRNLMGG